MALVSGPLMSIDASGTFKDALTFSIWKGRNYVRTWFRPTNPKTDAQQAQRTLMATAVAGWHGLYTGTKEAWGIAARDVAPPISGFNYYTMQYILQNGPPTIPAVAPKKAKTIHGRGSYGLT